ncbi:MAG: PLP-dependent aminotransferase family protein [Actinomycetota bacterium]
MTADINALYSNAASTGFSFYLPPMEGMTMPIVFEAGLPDPTTFPVEDLARLTEKVLVRDREFLQYGTPMDGDLSYGNAGLRQQLVERTARIDGRSVERNGVLLTGGGVQGISLCAQAFLDPGDVAAVECPTWEFILRDITLAGAEAIAIPIDEDGLRVDVLESEIRRLGSEGKNLKLVYTIATFNVPTAVCLSVERRKRLVELAAEHNFIIIEDNVYGDLRYEGEALPTLFSLDEAGLVLKIDSFSKTLNPALRLGWVTGDSLAISALDRVRRDLGVGQLVARVIGEFVGEGLFEPHIKHVNDLYRTKRDACLEALEEHCTGLMTWNRPAGGYFLWLELADDVDGRSVQSKAMAEGVMCRPGERFFGQTKDGGQFVRLAFSTVPVEDLRRAIEVLGRVTADSRG